MSLEPLADTTDLFDRGVDTSKTPLVLTMLQVASALVRAEAGSPIAETTSTVDLTGWRREVWLDLPGVPVTSVSSVSIDGADVTDYRRAGSRLWRRAGWGVDDGPATVGVTLTHGYQTVPVEIVNIVCDLATVGIQSAGQVRDPRVLVESVDDYSVTWKQGVDQQVATVMYVPRQTAIWLRSRFGGGVAMVTYR